MTKPNFRILITEAMAEEGLALLRAQPQLCVDIALTLSREDLLNKIPAYHALLVRSQTKVDKEIIAHGENLKLIGRAGVGIDNIDVNAAKAKNIAVINTPTGNSISAAELAFGLMLCLARHIPASHEHLRQAQWERKRFQGCELYQKTLGLLGFGNVGQLLAVRAKAFNMNVVAHDPWADAKMLQHHGVTLLSQNEMFARADFLSLHCALTEDTKNIINAGSIKCMKRGVMLINTARGELIDDHALLAALDEGQIKSAALDVFRKEPPDPQDPLLKHPKVLLTPHLGASTEEAQLRVSTLLAEQAIAFFARQESVVK